MDINNLSLSERQRIIRSLFAPSHWRKPFAKALGISLVHADRLFYGYRPLTVPQKARLRLARRRRLDWLPRERFDQLRFLMAFQEAQKAALQALPLD